MGRVERQRTLRRRKRGGTADVTLDTVTNRLALKNMAVE